MRVELELYSTTGRIEGRIRRPGRRDPVAFSGVLELLAALEALQAEPPPGGGEEGLRQR